MKFGSQQQKLLGNSWISYQHQISILTKSPRNISYISSNNGSMDLIVNHSKHIKSNDKPRKSVIKYNTKVVEGLNNLIAGIIKGIKEEESADSDDDW